MTRKILEAEKCISSYICPNKLAMEALFPVPRSAFRSLDGSLHVCMVAVEVFVRCGLPSQRTSSTTWMTKTLVHKFTADGKCITVLAGGKSLCSLSQCICSHKISNFSLAC